MIILGEPELALVTARSRPSSCRCCIIALVQAQVLAAGRNRLCGPDGAFACGDPRRGRRQALSRCCSSSPWSGPPTSWPISSAVRSAGRSWRRAISPGKTWSGAIGGTVAGGRRRLRALSLRLPVDRPLGAGDRLRPVRFQSGRRPVRILHQASLRCEGFQPPDSRSRRGHGPRRRSCFCLFRGVPSRVGRDAGRSADRLDGRISSRPLTRISRRPRSWNCCNTPSAF